MKKEKQFRLLLMMFFLLAGSGTVSGISIPGLDLSGGMAWLGKGETEGAPSPLMGIWGIGLPIQFVPLFSIEPEISMLGTQYQLASDGVKAIPTEIEYANSLWALMLLLDIPYNFTFRPSETISFGAGIHTSFLFRIPTIGWGTAAVGAEPNIRPAIAESWYSMATFIYPGAGIFFNWKIFPEMGFFVRVMTLLPLFHAWDGDDAPFWDQMYISARVGIRIFFRPNPVPPGPITDPEQKDEQVKNPGDEIE